MHALDRLRRFLSRDDGRLAYLAGAAVVVVLVGSVAVVAQADDEPEPRGITAAPTTTTTTTTTTEPPAPAPFAPLTGIEGEHEGRIHRPALFVKIDNVPRARPQAGLNQADIVFEEPVEGNTTRLAAVFHSTDAQGVGPVRSVRTTDLELVSLFGRVIFASSGGNGGVVPQIQAADVIDVGHNVTGGGFYRVGGRPAPHNLFSGTLELYAKSGEQPPPPRPLFDYLEPGEALPEGAIPVGGVALRFGGPEVSRFTWDAASETWPREQQGTPHVDAEGVQVAPSNVVVLEIDYDRSGQIGRSVPHGIVTGYGPALVLTQGQSVQGTWSRPTLADPLELRALDGSPIKLTPGQTFVELPVRGGWTYI